MPSALVHHLNINSPQTNSPAVFDRLTEKKERKFKERSLDYVMPEGSPSSNPVGKKSDIGRLRLKRHTENTN